MEYIDQQHKYITDLMSKVSEIWTSDLLFVVQCLNWCYSIVLGCVAGTEEISVPWMMRQETVVIPSASQSFPIVFCMHFTHLQSAPFQICHPTRTFCYWFINRQFNNAVVVTIYYKYVALYVKSILDDMLQRLSKFHLKNVVLRAKIQ